MAAKLLSRVEKCIARFRMLLPGDRVVVGCSGGADSTCLLDVLARGLSQLGLSLVAVYVDHGLRRETRAEQEAVANLARACGAEYVSVKIDVPARVRATGESVQEAARYLRYRELERIADDVGAARIAVGHTRTDQAETVLLQLIRGTGPKGLAGIAPVYGRIVRPLLDVSRQEAREYCLSQGIPFVDDPSNATGIYLRNRVRLELLPLLARYNPGIEEHLARLADILREEEALLDALVDEAARRLFRPVYDLPDRPGGQLAAAGPAAGHDHVRESVFTAAGGPAGRPALGFPDAGDPGRAPGVQLDGTLLLREPRAVSRRLVRKAYALLRGDEKGLSYDHVERILAGADRRRGTTVIGRFGGVEVRNEYGRLVFLKPDEGRDGGSGIEKLKRHPSPGTARTSGSLVLQKLPTPGKTRVEALGITVHTAWEDGGEDDEPIGGAEAPSKSRDSMCARIDWERIKPPLVVRSRRPGDRLRPVGLSGTKKVKDILIDAKVPRRLRDRVPIIEDAEGIIWVVGHALAERARPSFNSRKIMRIVVDWD